MSDAPKTTTITENKTVTVRAKMVCTDVDKRGDNSYTIRLSPVTEGSKENDKFYAATPGGMVTLDVVSESIAKLFEPRHEFYVDFQKV